MKKRRRPRSRDHPPELTSTSVRDPDARWAVIDHVLTAAPMVGPLRCKVAALLDQVRELGDFGLAEEIEEAGNELRAEMLDAVVVWAFEQGFREGQEHQPEGS